MNSGLNFIDSHKIVIAELLRPAWSYPNHDYDLCGTASRLREAIFRPQHGQFARTLPDSVSYSTHRYSTAHVHLSMAAPGNEQKVRI